MLICRFPATRDRNIWSDNEDFVMKKFLSALCATALTASVAVTGALPANCGADLCAEGPDGASIRT